MDNNKLVYNAIRTPDGTILKSSNRHDYKTHIDKNGHTYMVDGGIDYLRRNVVTEAPYEELSLTIDSPHEEIREVYHWGSYGLTGGSELIVKPLKDLDTNHIISITHTQVHLPEHIIQMFNNELEYRNA